MPNLEENLRYAITREVRCLPHQPLAAAFPVLEHDALKGCRLGAARRAPRSASYRLLCDGSSEATGDAHWTLGEREFRGTLNVRLGGKNMTFSQRVTARFLGGCAAGAP